MGNLSRMQGSPWHVERMERGDGDKRRHRSRCVHYHKQEKHCDYYHGSCFGSAHCGHYKEGNSKNKKFVDSVRKENVQVQTNNVSGSGITSIEMFGIRTGTVETPFVKRYSKVTLQADSKEEFSIIIVEDGRGDPFSEPMKVSETAALGKALLRHKEGDMVRVKINDEAVKYKITKIR